MKVKVMKKISDAVINLLIKNGTIEVQDYDLDIIKYGLDLKISKIYHICVMILISSLYRQLFEGILFIIIYSQLRQSAGGYHAKSVGGCWFITIIVMNIEMIGSRLIEGFTNFFIEGIIIVVICGMGIISLAPVDCYNKPIYENEVTVYKRKTIKTIAISGILFFVIGFFEKKVYASIIVTFIIQFAIMLLGRDNSPRYKGNKS